MIQPHEIRAKAERLYRRYLQAWLEGEEPFFPRVIPADKNPNAHNITDTGEGIRRLKASSKEVQGRGYTVEWKEPTSHTFGRNTLPTRILFETRDDFLHFIDKQEEFADFAQSVNRLRATFPDLEKWIRSNVATILTVPSDLEGLVGVVLYLREHPRPQRFARELPIPGDTKLIERHESLLREWLDLLLPPHAIRADEEHFARRYGLRYAEPHIQVRLLDEQLAEDLHFPCHDFSLPLSTLVALPVREAEIIVVENKVNLLTLPSMRRGFGLGGLGRGVTLLRYCEWMANLPVRYWGDLDVEGFEILSSLRAVFPDTRSLFMDEQTLDIWQHLAVPGKARKPEPLPNLTDAEQTAYVRCRDRNLRFEQERIPHANVLAVLGH